MAKRGLCLLLALATVFSLTAPALAEEEPVTAEEVVTEEVVEEPAAEPEEAVEEAEEEPEEPTEEPEEPVVTEEPVAEPMPAAETSGTCGYGVTWTLTDDGTLTISGTGRIANYGGSSYPWSSNKLSIKKIVIGDGVTNIGDEAFASCTSLESVTLPDSMTEIGDEAFYYCTSLTSVTIPASVTYIGEDAFYGCRALTIKGYFASTAYNYARDERIPFEALNVVTGVCGENVFWELNGATLTISGTGPMADYTWDEDAPWGDLTGQIQTVVIQPGVTTIGGHTFYRCYSLTSVTIPNSVTSIREAAFYSCTSLANVTIPSSVTSIGDYAFVDCECLTGVTIPNSVTSIGDEVFSSCLSLASVTISEGVTSIGARAFYHCTSLTSVTIPASVSSIGGIAFWGCDNLSNVTIQGGVKTIGESAFSYCPKLSSVAISCDKVSIGKEAFRSCTSLTNVTLQNGVSTIEEQAFRSCSSLTDIVLPSSVTSIGTAAFYDCPKLANVTILNKSCTIAANGWIYLWGDPSKGDDEYGFAATFPEGVAISGYKNSTAETYAKVHGHTFRALDGTSTPSTQLAAPTVKISKISGGIKVTWNKIAGSPRYMVYYRENGSGWKKIGTTTATSYIRAAKYLKDGKTYAFTVRCCADDKATLLSPYKTSGSLLYSSKLAAPSVTIAKTSSGIKVTWTKVASSPRYMVYYRENNGGWKKIGATTALTYTRAAKYLKNGVKYTFTVRCCANDKKTLLSNYKASNSLTYKK